jgi:hypothetical protein
MFVRILAPSLACAACVLAFARPAAADGIASPSPRPLGTGGAMRAIATGDAGPQLNPSGISLLRAYLLEGSYQYGSAADSHDARISAVDSTSAFNLGGALYYSYHRDSPGEGLNQTGHLFGGSLSFPLLDKIFLGGSAKYVHFADATSTTRKGFTFDAGLTVRPIPQLSIGAAGYNLLDRDTPWAPRAVGGGVAVLPMPMLLLVFDSVLEKVYDNSGRDKVMYYMGGGEFSFAASAAIRAGGGRDGLTKNGYVSAGVSLLSAEIGALDIGLRQDVSGAKKTTVFGVSARLFVPSM